MKKNKTVLAVLVGIVAVVAFVLMNAHSSKVTETKPNSGRSGTLLGKVERGALETKGVTESSVEESTEKLRKIQQETLLGRVLNEQLEWHERVEAMKKLGNDEWDSSVLSRLYAYLRIATPGDTEAYFVVSNEIMEVMQEHGVDPVVYFDELMRLIEDTTADEVMRDYAIQHLANWEASRLDGDEVLAQLDAFNRILDLVGDPRNAGLQMTGSAMNSVYQALLNSEHRDSESLRKQLEGVVLNFAKGGDRVILANRITAIQLASEMELPEMVGISRDILSQDLSGQQVAAGVRLSAIAALGLVGANEDLTLLSAYRRDSSLAYAAKVAIQRIQSRLN